MIHSSYNTSSPLSPSAFISFPSLSAAREKSEKYCVNRPKKNKKCESSSALGNPLQKKKKKKKKNAKVQD